MYPAPSHGLLGPSGIQLDPQPGVESLATDQGLPRMGVLGSEEEKLHPTPSLGLSTEEARRDDTRVIEDQQIARPQIVANLPKDTMLDLSSPP
jgi:hypothetical protein